MQQLSKKVSCHYSTSYPSYIYFFLHHERLDSFFLSLCTRVPGGILPLGLFCFSFILVFIRMRSDGVEPPSRFRHQVTAGCDHLFDFAIISDIWDRNGVPQKYASSCSLSEWTRLESNQRPSRCKRDALPS